MSPFELLNNPHLLHGLVVHFPVALGIVGFPFVLVSCVAGNNATLRGTACVLYLLLAALSFGATITGETALTAAAARFTPEIRAASQWHKLLASDLWIPSLVTAALILISGVKSEKLRGALAVLAILASLTTAAWTGATTYYGIAMAYEQNSNPAPLVPAAPAAKPPVSPAPAQTPAPAPAQTPAQSPPPVTTPPQPPAQSAQPPQPGAPSASHNPAQLSAPNTAAPASMTPPKQEGYLQGVASYWKDVGKKVLPNR